MNLGVLRTSKFLPDMVVVMFHWLPKNSANLISSLPLKDGLWSVLMLPLSSLTVMVTSFSVVTTPWVRTSLLPRPTLNYLVTMVLFSVSIYGWLILPMVTITFKLLSMVKSTDTTDLMQHMVIVPISCAVLMDGLKELSVLLSSFPTEVPPLTSPSEVSSMKQKPTNLLVLET